MTYEELKSAVIDYIAPDSLTREQEQELEQWYNTVFDKNSTVSPEEAAIMFWEWLRDQL